MSVAATLQEATLQEATTQEATTQAATPQQVTRANWRTAPFNRWAFRNVDALLRTADVANAPGDIWHIPSAPVSLERFRLRLREGQSLSLDDVLRATVSDGLVILHDGRRVFERYGTGMTPETPHIVMSATKSLTGLIAGILEAQGALDTSTLVSHYVPEIAHTPYAGATLRHLLDMRAGVRFDERGLRAYAAATGWEPEPDGGASDLHGFFTRLSGAPATHGTPFAYISANTDLLGWAIERAAGQSFASLVSTLLWQPMGAEAPAYITTDSKGAPRCTGGFCATVRDFARIGQLLVEGGARGERQIVPEALISDIEARGDRNAWTAGEFASGFSGLTMRYRGGWYIVDDAPKHMFAMGIHGQNLFVDRANNLVVAKVSSQATAIDHRAIGLTHLMFAEIRRCLLAR